MFQILGVPGGPEAGMESRVLAQRVAVAVVACEQQEKGLSLMPGRDRVTHARERPGWSETKLECAAQGDASVFLLEGN